MGKALRRFAALRVLLLVYALGLHLWVLFVLAISMVPDSKATAPAGL